ncbi:MULTISPECIES: hypothetical protein [unclassified Pseudomonas]|uniref:hypothetical protein n=1 Tax=unclassified Pseudomonas TaxID=196821 RepID=UPI0032088D26
MRNIKTREGFEFWDKLNALRRYAFLLSPSGKSVQKFEDQAMGNWIDVHEAQKVVDQAQDEINQFRAERDALQQRLNAADQLISEQRVALMRIHDRAEAFAEDGCSIRVASVGVIMDIAARALGPDGKPPVYKPGLYAVRHIDNWDGERDVALTFAMLDADGKWTEKETGEPLLTYKGDKILKAWPLDCSDAPGTQIIGVPRNWLEDWALELVEAAQDGGQMSNQVEHLLEIHAKP